ncbi:MAG: FAD-dependent oxidoreductase [Burkholderiales bacterium]
MNAGCGQRSRDEILARLAGERFDLLVIGGGATGVSVALDAANRGLKVALIEANDFAQGSSSRATKLLHGGVRYLAQGNIALVREALHERTVLLRNAPHLAQPLPFLIPVKSLAQQLFYGTGLRLYDALAGQDSLGSTAWLPREEALTASPRLRAQGLKGAVVYTDGQFDDARLAIAIARTAAREGALLINHVAVEGLIERAGRVVGAQLKDRVGGQTLDVQARCIVNATGVWVDDILRLQPEGHLAEPRVRPSQGIHAVLRGDWLDGRHAILIPRTRDGRVLFAVPWLGHTMLGTTDTAVPHTSLEPLPLAEELDFLRQEAAALFDRPVGTQDILSLWAGLRPLVDAKRQPGTATRKLSREHSIWTAVNGLITVTGGKWTTCRAMAQDVLAACTEADLLPDAGPCRTANLPLVGACETGVSLSAAPGLHLYGSEAGEVAQLPGADIEVAENLTEAMVRFAARKEWAVQVGDVLARRSRLLFLDARAAERAAPRVAEILLQETGFDPALEVFMHTAAQYHVHQQSHWRP